MADLLNTARSRAAVGIAAIAAGLAAAATELDQSGEARKRGRKARHARHERDHDGRHHRSSSDASEQDDDHDDGVIEVAAKNRTPTPVPTNTPGPSPTPTITEQNAAIQNAQGQTLVGYDPVTQSWVAAGDGHIAVSGPTGARVILDTEQVIVIPPDGGNFQPTPVPGGNPEPGFNS